ncbi:hypothetical protein TDB9533_01728 [Thalassocella blandensis]|nr:hypothetical protein TDB9533_01728 [Thalassocella blandensis]
MKVSSHKHRQKGVGLIEILVTVLLLSTALLSLAVMQKRSLQFNHEAYLRSQANILAYDIIDRARANIANIAGYNVALAANAPTGASRAETDLRDWLGNIAVTLPNGDGQIICNSTTHLCSVVMSWQELESENGTTAFVYETVL